jgi:hypothetical protein
MGIPFKVSWRSLSRISRRPYCFPTFHLLLGERLVSYFFETIAQYDPLKTHDRPMPKKVQISFPKLYRQQFLTALSGTKIKIPIQKDGQDGRGKCR